jgi:hypothetical protein
VLLLCAGLVFWLHAAQANAEESDVDELLERGIQLREQNKDAEALVVFQRAFELSQGPRVQAQLALTEQALGRWVRAEANLTAALSATGDPWITQHRAALEGALAKMREHLGDLEVLGGVSGAELLVDGARAGTLPLARPLRLEIGTRLIEVRAPGYYPINKSVVVTPSGTSRITLEMHQRADDTPGSAGTGEAGTTPPLNQGPAGESAPRSNTLSILAWGAAGTSAALLGLGAVSLGIRSGKVSDYNDDPSCPGTRTPSAGQSSACQDRIAASEDWGTVATASFIGGGVLGAAAVVLFVVDGSKPRESARLACGSGRMLLGVQCHGTF